MGKKTKKDETELSKTVDKLIKDVGEDRDVLVKFLKDLISEYDGEKAVGIAEYVAKLADALTRQNQVRVATIKAAAKQAPEEIDDDLDEIADGIGMPFKVEDQSTGN